MGANLGYFWKEYRLLEGEQTIGDEPVNISY
jgi:hypothetical protein